MGAQFLFHVKKVFLLLLISLMLLSCGEKEDNAAFVINFDTQEYEGVQLVINTENDNRIIVNGDSLGGSNWRFSYPDSLKDRVTGMYLSIPSADSITRKVFIDLVVDNDTLSSGNYIFGSKEVNLRWRGRGVLPNFRVIDPITGKIKNTTLFIEGYEVGKDVDMELTSSIFGLSKGYGYKNYNDLSEVYVELTKRYPDSQYLISKLYNSITRFDSDADIESVYQYFSESNKKSYYGQKLKDYLSVPVFKNISLQTWDTGVLEPVIQDSTRYNLVVFSASWCGPCHAMIPLIREIDNDLGKALTITYISTDEDRTAENWKKMMQEEKIPWRSLIAGDKLKEVKEKYIVQVIPHAILVQPYSMKMKIIDIRKEKDRNELYQLLAPHS